MTTFIDKIKEQYADQKLPSLRVIRRFERAAWGLPLRGLPEDEFNYYYGQLDGDSMNAEVEQKVSEAEAWLYKHRNEPELLDGMPSDMLRDFLIDYESRMVTN